MHDQVGQAPTLHRRTIGPTDVVAWMRDVIAHAERLPRSDLIAAVVAPAGQCIEVNFDDPEVEEAYRARLYDMRGDGRPGDRLYVLARKSHGFEIVPEWDGAACPAPAFQEIMAGAGLRAVYPTYSQFWRFYDPELRVGIQLSGENANLPRWDGTAPLRHHLHWILEGAGLRLAHAAALGWQGRGVVLFGRGGAGKSGTTLSGLAAGLSTVGDDLIALGAGRTPVARALFRVVKQDRTGLARLPRLFDVTSHRASNWYGKVEFDPDDYFPGALVPELGLRAVVLPRIAHAEKPAIVPATAGEAMRALLTSNLRLYPGAKETGMAFFARLLAQLPSYRMDLSDNAAKNGEALRGFLESETSEAGLRPGAPLPARRS